MDYFATCQDLTYRRTSGFQLGPINLQLAAGVTCLVGPNGAGKSTLFGLISGLEEPHGGTIKFANNAANLGFLPQNPGFPRRATCLQFLMYVGWLQQVPKAEQLAACHDALASVDLSDKASTKIGALSGGMQRRLGIAQAILHRPDVLLLDEPTVGLDPAQRVGLRATIEELGQDRAVLLSTHLVEDVRGLAERIIVLNNGQIHFDGTIEELETLANPAALGETPLERAFTTVIGATR